MRGEDEVLQTAGLGTRANGVQPVRHRQLTDHVSATVMTPTDLPEKYKAVRAVAVRIFTIMMAGLYGTAATSYGQQGADGRDNGRTTEATREVPSTPHWTRFPAPMSIS